MAVYNKYRYIYPCRPKNAIPSKDIVNYDDGRFLAEPKVNGSNCVIFTNKKEFKVMNRHNQAMADFRISKEEIFDTLPNDGWNIIVGEYMNKAKRDENKNLFNHKLIIHDLLCFDSEYFLGRSFDDRMSLAYDRFNPKDYNNFMYKISDNINIVRVFYNDFTNLYNELIKIDMVEGLVIKRKNALLEIGLREENNHMSQVKSRKPEKNIRF